MPTYYNLFESVKELFELFYDEELDKEAVENIIYSLVKESDYLSIATDENDEELYEDADEAVKDILSSQKKFDDFLGVILEGHIQSEIWEFISNDYKFEE